MRNRPETHFQRILRFEGGLLFSYTGLKWINPGGGGGGGGFSVEGDAVNLSNAINSSTPSNGENFETI